MTKQRPPVSFNRALTKIAALIGWDSAAAICNVAERTVRNWSDPDTDAEMSLRDALRLDTAYQKAGGVGAPLLNSYMLRLDIEIGAEDRCRHQLLAATAKSAGEAGEAVSALIKASNEDATNNDFRAAMIEAEEAVQALSGCIALIKSIGGR